MPVANDTETGTVYVVQRPRPNAPELIPGDESYFVLGAIGVALILSVVDSTYDTLDLAVSVLLGVALVLEFGRLRRVRSVRQNAMAMSLKLGAWLDEQSGWIAGHDATTTDAVLANPQPTLQAGWRVLFRPDPANGLEISTRPLTNDSEMAVLHQTEGDSRAPGSTFYSVEPV